jgi:hypothetical protein
LGEEGKLAEETDELPQPNDTKKALSPLSQQHVHFAKADWPEK